LSASKGNSGGGLSDGEGGKDKILHGGRGRLREKKSAKLGGGRGEKKSCAHGRSYDWQRKIINKDFLHYKGKKKSGLFRHGHTISAMREKNSAGNVEPILAD